MLDGRLEAQQDYFGDIPALPISASPDGRRFLVITRCGDLERDESVFTLRVFDTAHILHSLRTRESTPSAVRTTEVRSKNNHPAIFRPEWSADGRFVRFESTYGSIERESRVRHLALDVSSGQLTLLADFPIDGFSLARASGLIDWTGTSALFVAALDPRPAADLTPHYPIEVLSGAWLKRMGDPGGFLTCEYSECEPRKLALFYSTGGTARKVIDLPDDQRVNWPNGHLRGGLSPDGGTAIVIMPRQSNALRTTGLKQISAEQIVSVINLSTSAVTPILSMAGNSIADLRPIHWAPNSQQAVIVGPETNGTISKLTLYDRKSGEVEPLPVAWNAAAQLKSVKWSRDGQAIVTEWSYGNEGAGTPKTSRVVQFTKENQQWRPGEPVKPPAPVWTQATPQDEIMSAPYEEWLKGRDPLKVGVGPDASWFDFPSPQPFRFASGLELVLQEGPNQPQRLVASLAGRELTVVDVDPRLNRIELAQSQVIEWKSSEGQLHRGLLTLPRRSTDAPPLVLQVYRYMPNVFRPDGMTPSGFARQALAARGIAVLEASFSDIPAGGAWEEEIPPLVDMIEAALDELARRRLVDTTRVGALGFSRSGFHARQLLVHMRRYHLSAASANDSFTNSYTNYLRELVVTKAAKYSAYPIAQEVGVSPWEDFEKWRARSDDLSANRATGALLETCQFGDIPFIGMHYGNLAGAYMSAGRPFDAFILAEGTHSLQRPKERLASLSLNVDWFDFWLQGHEDRDPAKMGQYKRWREMRDQWDRQRAWEAAGHLTGSEPDPKFTIPTRSTKQ